MSSRALTEGVLVRGPDGTGVFLAAGEDLPDWAVDQVDEHALDGNLLPDLDETDPDDPAGHVDDGEHLAGDPDGPVPPPRHGEGSGRAAWAAYAAELDVAIDRDDKRDDIIAKVAGAGYPVEAQPAE